MIKQQLLALAEPDYQRFSSRLLPGTENIIGVRLPHLRKIAKQIAKQEGSAYLFQADDSSFEEVMIQGMVIGYLQKSDIEEVLNELNQIQHQGYYVQMAVAWAISLCFIQNQDLTLVFLNQNNLDDFTYNKSLQKITESFKVDSQTKQIIHAMKRSS